MRSDMMKLVIFELGGDLFAADVLAVDRVLRYATPSAVPDVPAWVEGVIEHELTEGIMGRIGSLGVDDPSAWAPMDLFRFTASGQRDFTGGADGRPTYFSVNGSTVYTGLQFHNSVNSSHQFDGFDLAVWDQVGADANAHDPFGPGGPGAGDPGTLSATDIMMMEALGWSPPSAGLSVTAQNFSVSERQSVSIANYFTVANPTGDSITQYAFEDQGGGSALYGRQYHRGRQPDLLCRDRQFKHCAVCRRHIAG